MTTEDALFMMIPFAFGLVLVLLLGIWSLAAAMTRPRGPGTCARRVEPEDEL